MNKDDAKKVIKDLNEKPFICTEHTIETNSGYVIRTGERQRPFRQTNENLIKAMTTEELAKFLCKVKADYQWKDHEFPSEDECTDWEEWLKTETKE